jgi:inosine-uridine nucleoside N-ribohydrolase
MARKLILDVDTGTDDAVAVMLAAMHPALDLLGCTTVNGNIPVQFCTDNTLRVLDHIGRSGIPVYEGLARPIARLDFPVPRRERDLAGKYHPGVLPVPPPVSRKQDAGAIEFLIETYRAATEEIVLVPVAPLTNIATCVLLDPGFAKRVPELVIMGGAHAIGNVTASAEFNVWGDPEAAAMVFAAGFPKITLVPLDATHRALITKAQCEELEALGTPAGQAAAAFIGHRIAVHEAHQKQEIPQSTPVHDALAVGAVIDPSLIATRRLHVAVETQGALTVGRTVIDTHFRGGQTPNADVAFDADAARFFELLLRTFAAKA